MNRRAWFSLLVVTALASVLARSTFAGQVLAGRDVFRLFIPDNALLLDSLRAFDWPLWNPYERMGQPFAASMQVQAFYLPRIVSVLLCGPVVASTAMQLIHVVIAAWGVAWFLMPLVRRWYTPWVAGGFFALSPMFTDLAMQQNVVDAAAWTGFLLGAVQRASPRVFALSLAMSLLAASPETTLWQLMLAAAVAWQFEVPRLKFAAALAVGFGLAGLMLVPAAEFTSQSIRGAESLNSGDWSMSWWQVVGSFWPAFDVPADEYWGDDQHFVPNVFLGTLPVALALLGVVRGPKRVRALAAGGLVLLVFSMGQHVPILRWLLELPPLNFFRYPAKAYVGAAFVVAVLAAFGVEAMARLARERATRRSTLLGVAAWAGLGLLGWWAIVRMPLRAGASLGAPWLWIALGAAALLYRSVPGGWRRAQVVTASVALLAMLEIGLARLVFVISESEPAAVLSAPASWVGALPSMHQRISAGVTAVSGTLQVDDENKIAVSREFLVPNRFIEERLETVNGYGAPEPRRFERLAQTKARGFFDLAGVTHYLDNVGSPQFSDLTLERTLTAGVGLYSSKTALPRAFVVQKSVIVDDQQALERIEEDRDQPFRHTAFLAGGPRHDGTPCESEVRREPISLRRVAYSVDACADGLLVMTDSYFPGWQARVDAAGTPVLRVDYAFLAVEVTKGRHHVELTYWPASFTIGLVTSAVSLLLLLLPWFKRGRTPGVSARRRVARTHVMGVD